MIDILDLPYIFDPIISVILALNPDINRLREIRLMYIKMDHKFIPSLIDLTILRGIAIGLFEESSYD